LLTQKIGEIAYNALHNNLVDVYKQSYGSELPYQTYMQDVYDSIHLLRDGIAEVGYDGVETC